VSSISSIRNMAILIWTLSLISLSLLIFILLYHPFIIYLTTDDQFNASTFNISKAVTYITYDQIEHKQRLTTVLVVHNNGKVPINILNVDIDERKLGGCHASLGSLGVLIDPNKTVPVVIERIINKDIENNDSCMKMLSTGQIPLTIKVEGKGVKLPNSITFDKIATVTVQSMVTTNPIKAEISNATLYVNLVPKTTTINLTATFEVHNSNQFTVNVTDVFVSLSPSCNTYECMIPLSVSENTIKPNETVKVVSNGTYLGTITGGYVTLVIIVQGADNDHLEIFGVKQAFIVIAKIIVNDQ